MMVSMAEQKGLDLVLDVPESLPSVFLDRLRVRQVLLNLLNNAIRLIERGQIAISACVEREAIRINVARHILIVDDDVQLAELWARYI